MSETDKLVVIMYPDCRTTGGIPGPNNGRTPPDRLLSDEFFRTADRLLGRYKNQGYQVYGVIYMDTEPENFSPLYPITRFDELIPVNTDLEHWDREEHQELLEEVATRLHISPGTKTIIGGYHAFDCVAQMVKVLRDKGYQVAPNLLLTNELGPLLVAHRIKRMMGSMCRKEDREWDRLIWQSQYNRFEYEVLNS